MLLEDLWNCKHEFQIPVFRVFSNGTKHYGYQCDSCGKWIPKKICEFQVLPDAQFDEKKRDSLYAECAAESQKALQERKDAESKDWWERYDSYLSSETWIRRREKILERDNHVCQGCLSRSAAHVHHLTYAHVFEELAFELISLCEQCHKKAHGKDNSLADIS